MEYDIAHREIKYIHILRENDTLVSRQILKNAHASCPENAEI